MRWAALLACSVILCLLAVADRATAQSVPEKPAISGTTPAAHALTVTWTAPADTGGTAIIAYDLRHVPTNAPDKGTDDAVWTVVQDVWVTGGGALSHQITGLRDSTSHDIQVRAVNSAGDGPWSDVSVVATIDNVGGRVGVVGQLNATHLVHIDYKAPSSTTLGDRDALIFTVTETTRVWFYSTGPINSAIYFWRIEPTESNGALEYDGSSRWLEGLAGGSVEYTLQPGNTYLLSIGSFNGNYVGPVDVHTSVLPASTSDRTMAPELTLGRPVKGSIDPPGGSTGDSEYFKFTLDAPTDVWVVAYGHDRRVRGHPDYNMDTNIELQQEDGTVFAMGDDGGWTNALWTSDIRRTNLAAGTYYVRVWGDDGFPDKHHGNYELIVKEFDPPGATQATATAIHLNAYFPGAFSSATDKDYYSIIVDSPQWVDFYISERGDSGNPANNPVFGVKVYDPRGSEVPVALSRRSGSSYDTVQSLARVSLLPGKNYIEVSTDRASGDYVILPVTNTALKQMVDACPSGTQSDAFYTCQWHLNNTGQFAGGDGADINVEEVWATNKGEGVTVAIVDDGVQLNHEDLRENVDVDLNHDYHRLSIFEGESGTFHGTAVAGTVAARDNAWGVRGVAPRATLYSLNLTNADFPYLSMVDVLTRHAAVTGVSSNSWALTGAGKPLVAGIAWETAAEQAATTGFDGKGVVFVHSGGNYHVEGDNANLNSLANFHTSVAVCAIGHYGTRSAYSERGASLWVCAPSNGSPNSAITTTADGNLYTRFFTGTSAATPIVSGVVALIRAENPALTARDVKLILAASARKNDPRSSGWAQAGVKYGSTSDRYNYSHDYGFGAVDAGAAVELAKTWTLLPTERTIDATSETLDLAVGEARADGTAGTAVTSSLTLDPFVEFIEYIEVKVTFDHPSARDLQIQLRSPSGAVSTLAYAATRNQFRFLPDQPVAFPEAFRFGSARHVGENAAGTWTLTVTDRLRQNTGSLTSWSIKAYGHGVATPSAPPIPTATAGARSLTVGWTAPADPPDGSMITITSYDLRYIRSSATNKTDPANWTVATGIGTDDTGTYEITGLGPGVQYDVQVRALSNSRAGPWSESLVVRSSLEKPFVPSLTGVTPRDTGLGAAWTAPTEDGGSEITSYDLRTIRSNASQTDKDDPTQWDETFSAWTTGGVELRGRVANLTNGVRYDVQVRATNAIGTSDWSGTRTGTPNVQNTDPSFAEETTTREVAENLRLGGNVGARISATDSNRDPLTYSIRGANDLFEIDAMNGQLRTKVELDADEGVTSHTLTVEVSDGLNSSDDEDLTIDDSIEVTIAVTNVNEQPLVEGTTAIDHAENEGTALAGASYSATDPERANIIWSLGGNDGGKFAISSGGVLSFAAEPDFDARADRNRDNIYEVTVRATEEDDGDTQTRELTGTLAVTVTLTDVNEPPVVRRRSGTGAFSIVENSGTDVGAFDATDPEGGGVTWSLATSGDHGRFEIDAANGALSFKEAPDYESSDLGSDKAYTVTVQATEQDDGEPLTRELTGDLDVTVTITNENEPPMVTRSSGMGAFSIVENSGREVGSFRADDPEGRAVTWSLATTGNHGRFEIDATRGVLSFKDPPDYESSDLGSGLVRAYNVTVRATEADDGDPQTRERRGSLAVTVTITNVNEPPVVRRSSGAGAFSIVENSGTDVGRFVATDPEGAGVTWSDLSGNDADDFDLSNNGVLTFKVSPDYEMKREYEVTLNAYDGRFTGRLDVTVTIANVNEQPMVARRSGTGPFSIVENSGTDVGDFEATDPEGHAVTWSLETTGDHARFEIDAANGALSLKETPDYESSDLGSDKAYNVTVRATEADDGDADPLTGTLAVTVRITNVNEPPTITENATPSVRENTTAVATYRATDPDERATITWSVEDPGASDFTITNAGALSFASAPNYEVKSSYTVTVRASDGSNDVDQVVTVAVTDVDETEVLELSLRRPLIGEDYTASFEQGTGDVVQSPTWQWSRSTSRNSGHVAIIGATAATYRPTGDDRDYFLRVTASYNDGHGQARKTLQATSVLPTLATSASNEPPAFPDQLFTGGVTGLSVPENANAPTLVGTAPQATDPESKPLRYSLAVSGFTTDPPFEINATSRQIRVVSGAALDHEDQETYSVTVTAEDEFNATDTATFDITVEDVNERPVAEDDPSVTTAEDMPVTFDVLGNDTDPDEGDTLTVMTITTQPRRGRVVADPGTQMLTYTPAKDDHDTYTFMYTASDDDPDRRLTSRPAQVTVTVNSVNDAPEFATETTTRTVSEGAQPGDEVGTKLAATDVDDSTLTYSLSGASDFVIDASGPTAGQIRVAPGVTLDREHTSSYEVTVTADDGKGGTDSITVTINVSDVPEPPTAMNDTARTDEDQSVRIDVLDNDTDPDTPQANLRVSVLRQPLNGRAHVESDKTIIYTPTANFADPDNPDSFTYRVSDGRLTDDGSVTVTVIPVNDAPTFPSLTAARSVPVDAAAGDNVGVPVTATDVDSGDVLTYSLSGADVSSFDIDPDSGQITVGDVDVGMKPTYSVTVEADDGEGERAIIEVTITVTTGPVVVVTPPSGGGGGGGGFGGGGGGGGPSGPSPSEADFEWTVKRDIKALGGGHDTPAGLWSDGTTLWVLENGEGADDAVYAYDLKTGERVEEREFELDEANRAPRGAWSDGSTVWVSDSGRERLFAHNLETGARLPERDIAFAERNRDARGIWSDHEAMWVLDGGKDSLFTYDLATGELRAEYALASTNGDPHGIWSDGVTVWVSDHGAKRLFAYRLPAPEGPAAEDAEPQDLDRVSDEEFGDLSKASNNSPRGIWSDGEVMYVADESDGKVYTYNMPDAIDARLGSLSLSGVEIGEFDPGTTEYEGAPAEGVTETTVEAEAVQRRTDVAIHPPDADADTAGHQVSLAETGEITVTVTSADGTRTRVYRVALETPPVELALTPTWTAIDWPGADGVAMAEAGLPDTVVAVYWWDEESRSWLAHFPGLDDVPGLTTLTTFSTGATYWVAVSDTATWTVVPGAPPD